MRYSVLRTLQFIRNSISAALLQLANIIVGFILPRVMLDAYGSEINGLVSSVQQFVGYFSLVEAGLAGAAVYALYKPLADDNIEEINGIVSAARKFYIQAGIIFTFLVLIFSLAYPIFLKTDALKSWQIGILVMAIGLSGSIDFFLMSKYRVLLTAAQKISVISTASIVSLIINTLFTLILAYSKVSIVLLKIITIMSVLTRSIILSLYVRKNYPSIRYNAIPAKKSLSKRWDAFYLQILGSVQNGAPVIILTLFSNLKAVSVYTIFNMVLSGINNLLAVFTNGLSSSFGEVLAKGQEKTLHQASQEFEVIYYMLISWFYSCSAILLMPFIRIYTHGIIDANYNDQVLGFLFVLNGILYSIKSPQGMLVISAGMFRETRAQTTIQGLIAVLGGLILVQFFGIYGVVIALCLSNIYRDFDLFIFVPQKITKLPIHITILRAIRVLLCIIINVGFSRILNITSTSVHEWVICAFINGAISAVIIVVLNLVFDYEFVMNAAKRILHLKGSRR